MSIHLKTDIQAVCSKAFLRSDAMLVPRHISPVSVIVMLIPVIPMLHGICGGGEEPVLLGEVGEPRLGPIEAFRP